MSDLHKHIADLRAEIARLTAELAAARAVPADVDALLDAWGVLEIHTSAGGNQPADVAAANAARDRVSAAIARAISDATTARDDEWASAIVPFHGAPDTGGDPIDRAVAGLTASRATVGGLLATENPHPDGCHSADAMEARDCDTDGHMSCPTCTRNSRGPLPKGG